MVAREHEVRFSKLHEKRAEIISELYGLLREANNSTDLFDLVFQTGPLPGLPFDSDAADKSRDQFAERLRINVRKSPPFLLSTSFFSVKS